MASSLNGTDAAACSVDHGDVVVGNLLRLRSNESFNDVQFSLRDGTVYANSVILSMRSGYFATMISRVSFQRNLSGNCLSGSKKSVTKYRVIQ